MQIVTLTKFYHVPAYLRISSYAFKLAKYKKSTHAIMVRIFVHVVFFGILKLMELSKLKFLKVAKLNLWEIYICIHIHLS